MHSYLKRYKNSVEETADSSTKKTAGSLKQNLYRWILLKPLSRRETRWGLMKQELLAKRKRGHLIL